MDPTNVKLGFKCEESPSHKEILVQLDRLTERQGQLLSILEMVGCGQRLLTKGLHIRYLQQSKEMQQCMIEVVWHNKESI